MLIFFIEYKYCEPASAINLIENSPRSFLSLTFLLSSISHSPAYKFPNLGTREPAAYPDAALQMPPPPEDHDLRVQAVPRGQAAHHGQDRARFETRFSTPYCFQHKYGFIEQRRGKGGVRQKRGKWVVIILCNWSNVHTLYVILMYFIIFANRSKFHQRGGGCLNSCVSCVS